MTTSYQQQHQEQEQFGITVPHKNDVLSGRGRGINKHPGNKKWRDLIIANQTQYMALPRNQRPVITEAIVKAVRALSPPGRFLAKDPNTGLFYEIGEDKANEKTAQAMRDTKKQAKDSSPSPPSPTQRSSPVEQEQPRQDLQEPPSSPVSVAECSPAIQKPNLDRISTEDTFAARMQDFTFAPPPFQRISSSTMSCITFTSMPNSSPENTTDISSLPSEQQQQQQQQQQQPTPLVPTLLFSKPSMIGRNSTCGSQISFMTMPRLSERMSTTSLDMLAHMDILEPTTSNSSNTEEQVVEGFMQAWQQQGNNNNNNNDIAIMMTF